MWHLHRITFPLVLGWIGWGEGDSRVGGYHWGRGGGRGESEPESLHRISSEPDTNEVFLHAGINGQVYQSFYTALVEDISGPISKWNQAQSWQHYSVTTSSGRNV